jgi:hypothetical protein
MDYRSAREDFEEQSWSYDGPRRESLKPINLAPLKGALESDPVRSRILSMLIENGTWVTTADLLRAARQVRPVIGAVTIGTILNGLNELVSSRLILSRMSMSSGIDWAEWRINPDWLSPTRKLLNMLIRARKSPVKRQEPSEPVRLLERLDDTQF